MNWIRIPRLPDNAPSVILGFNAYPAARVVIRFPSATA
jgi:hypothetical protein